ncbi:uncharacterized protein LOC135367501 [Ornithodoros turicata]|uniref:uncharacterized protein LOC135367501 n=1 Tax=Ornithodoros turicata TaxID=34597 RepID=UPI003138A127
MSQGDNAAPSSPHVTAVAVKLPPFWDRNPAIWFAQAEAQFHLSGITSQTTRFYNVISALSPTAAEEVHDLITSPPPEHPYDRLKAALLKRTSTSDRERLRQLLSAEELGDRRPTQLLRRMKQLLGDDVSAAGDRFQHQLFMQRLPTNVQMVLATASNLPLDELASLADAVMEVASPHQVSVLERPAALQNATPPPQADHRSPLSPPDIQVMAQQISHLTQLVASLVTRPRSPSPRRPRHRRGPPSERRSRSRSDSSGGLCWYHRRFGANANHCLLPCTWTGNPPASH